MNTQDPVTFEDDLLDRSDFSDRLQSFLSVEKDYVEGSLVVSLDGGFGSGKTTFIRMWRNRLLERREAGEFEPMPVLLNAWESDHCGDPLVAILAGLVEAVENWKGKDKPNHSQLKQAAQDVGWFALGLANEIASKVAVDAAKVGKFAEDKRAAHSQPQPDFLRSYQERVAALKRLKQELASAFGGKDLKVIVFVDELDRCRPDYAVAYLETIKHVFDIEGIAFVLAVHYAQLSGSAKALFGADLDVEEYFRKFCHRSFSLPVPTKNSQRKLCAAYVKKYLQVEGRRNSALQLSEGLAERINELVSALDMNPRQVQQAFRVLGHDSQRTDSFPENSNLRWGVALSSVLLSILSVVRPETVNDVRKTDEGWHSLCKDMVLLLGKSDAEWWVQLILKGAGGSDCKKEETLSFLNELGYSIEGSEALERFLYGFGGYNSWSGNRDEFRNTAARIAEARSV